MNNQTPMQGPAGGQQPELGQSAGRLAPGLCLRMKSPWPGAMLPPQRGRGGGAGRSGAECADARPGGAEGRLEPSAGTWGWAVWGGWAAHPRAGGRFCPHLGPRRWGWGGTPSVGRSTPTIQGSASWGRASVSPPVSRGPHTSPRGGGGAAGRVGAWCPARGRCPVRVLQGGTRGLRGQCSYQLADREAWHGPAFRAAGRSRLVGTALWPPQTEPGTRRPALRCSDTCWLAPG